MGEVIAGEHEELSLNLGLASVMPAPGEAEAGGYLGLSG